MDLKYISEIILEKFLRANRAEVIAVSIFEYNKEEEEQKLRKAEYACCKVTFDFIEQKKVVIR